jgi:hypothetical protein
MAQAALECANAALRKIGSGKIAALNGTDDLSVLLNDRIDICKRTLLRMHPWNFAIRRDKLRPYLDVAVSNVTLISDELLEVTHTSTTYAVGNWVQIHGVAGAIESNGTFEVSAIPAGTTTRVTAPGVTSLTTYVAGTLDFIRRVPAFDFSYLYDMPSDCLRVLKVDDQASSPDWRIEGRFIMSDVEDELEFKYIYDVTDYTTMDILFYELLSHYLAWDISYRVTQSSQLKQQLFEEMRVVMKPFAKFVDATEDPAEKLQADEWVNSRFGGSPWQGSGRYY